MKDSVDKVVEERWICVLGFVSAAVLLLCRSSVAVAVAGAVLVVRVSVACPLVQ